MNFDHAESAVLATVHTAMPQGYALPALNHKGLPDFEVTPKEAREAFQRLAKLMLTQKLANAIAAAKEMGDGC